MNEIVKYHNDFNRISLPSFNEQEQNLLFAILSQVKEKGYKEDIRLYAKDLLLTKELSNSREYLTSVMNSLKVKFFKADFRRIIETDTKIIDETFNLFQKMQIHYTKRNPHDGYDTSKLFEMISLTINPQFEYLVNELTAHFTRFELVEFIALSGKYTKTLYRLLKQYRATGFMKMKWDEFRHILDIPESYEMRDIEKQILKPAVKELTAERTLFDSKRTPFKNLTYTKQKGKGRGRGGNVIGIQFTFLPQELEVQELEKAQMSIEQEKQSHSESKLSSASIESFKAEYLNRHILTYNKMTGLMDTSKITDLIIEPEKITIMLKNVDTQKSFTMFFENQKGYKINKMLLGFANWFEKNKA